LFACVHEFVLNYRLRGHNYYNLLAVVTISVEVCCV